MPLNNIKGETPSTEWANWALLSAAIDPHTEEQRAAALPLLAARFQLLHGMPENRGPRSFVIATSDGHWGRGDNLHAAAGAALKAGARRTAKANAVLVLNDATPELNQGGDVISDTASEQIALGWVGTIGSILNGKP